MLYAFCCVMAGLVGRGAEQGGFIARVGESLMMIALHAMDHTAAPAFA
jgi:hypothetical protein